MYIRMAADSHPYPIRSFNSLSNGLPELRNSSDSSRMRYAADLMCPSTFFRKLSAHFLHLFSVDSHGLSSSHSASSSSVPSITSSMIPDSYCLYGMHMSGNSLCVLRQLGLVHFLRSIRSHSFSPPICLLHLFTQSFFFNLPPQSGHLGSSLLLIKNICCLVVLFVVVCYDYHGF